MTGFVYAIVAADACVKIGWSASPKRRVAEVRVYCPIAPVYLAGATPGTPSQEREIQVLLEPWRTSGEWFDLRGPPVAAFVSMISEGSRIRNASLTESDVSSVAGLIDLWPSAESFGIDLCLKRRGDHARVMKVRGKIPRERWPHVVEAACRRGLPVTQGLLERLHTRSARAA